MMKRLSLGIKNKSPFSIAVSRAVGNVQECLDFIPGTAVRGALASLYLKNNKPDSYFKALFTENKVVFSNLYINNAKPIPLSAYSCKYHGGFLGDREKHGVVDFGGFLENRKKHGVVDLLLQLIREKEQGIELPDELKKCQEKVNSETCGIETKRFRGYYQTGGSLKSVNLTKRLIYHTAISHVSETALENALFSQEVIETGQVFYGEILTHDDSLFNRMKDFIEKQNALFIGSDKSVGLGSFEIISFKKMDGFNKDRLNERLDQFNKNLGLNNDNGRTYFSITLQSDAIVTDSYMRYKSLIEPEDLGISSAQRVLGISESRTVQGWNAMAGLPKEDMMTIEKGSVFVFSVNGCVDDLIEKLFKIEVYGIGKRREEGFGRLTICDPFHLEEGRK